MFGHAIINGSFGQTAPFIIAYVSLIYWPKGAFGIDISHNSTYITQ
jgi:hypothetical protein